MAEKGYDELVRDLRALGRGADLPGASRHLVTTVVERVSAAPEPGRLSPWTPLLDLVAQRVGSWRRRVALAGAAVLLAVLATPPVRAAVADWFGFGGVMVQPGAPEVGSAAPPPEVATGTSMVDAAASVGFAVSVPTELGVPDGVEVSPDRRVVSMSWTTDEAGVLLLEQFDARLDFTVAKQVPEVRYAAVDRSDALWFEEPHEVTLLEADGSAITYNPRLAGHTLVWQDGSTSLASLVGTGGEVHRVDRSGRSHESGPGVTVTWMIHDVTPWRVDRIYLAGPGAPWIATQILGEAGGPCCSPVWHQPEAPVRLERLLDRLGVGEAARQAGEFEGVAGAPTPAAAAPPASAETEPETPAAATRESSGLTGGLAWGLIGAVTGVALSLLWAGPDRVRRRG